MLKNHFKFVRVGQVEQEEKGKYNRRGQQRKMILWSKSSISKCMRLFYLTESESNLPHFHWPVSDSCQVQVRRMTDETNWIHSRDMIEVRSTTLRKEMRRSTRLYTYEKSLTDGQEVSTTWALLPGFRPSWSNCITLWDYCLCLAQDILLSEKLSTQVRIIFHPFSHCPNERSGNLRLKMDSSTDDAFQGKSHDTAFSHSLICLIDE